MRASGRMNRREWLKLSVGAAATLLLPGAQNRPADKPNFSKDHGVILGVQSWSFRDWSVERMLAAMNELGLRSCELWEGHVAPPDIYGDREALKNWRSTVTIEEFYTLREKFDNAGIDIQAYTVTMKDNITDEEMDCIFSMTKALGTDILTSSATVSVMPRIDVYAQKYNVYVGMHNHAHVNRPNEFSTPETFARGMKGNSDYIRINLDIGHATAANYDPAEYMKEVHEKIVCIHVKDRKRDNGPRTPFGEGDTPIREVLQQIRDNDWPVPANIELEYGEDTMKEMERCVEYCRKVLSE